MAASSEMPRIAIKTGVVAAISAIAMAGSPEQAKQVAEAEAMHLPTPEHVTHELGRTSVAAVLPPPQVERSAPQPRGPQSMALKLVSPKVPKVLRAIRGCESGHGAFTTADYTVVNKSGHGGAYQFDPGTWDYFHGYPRAELAPKKTQDRRAIQVLHVRGTQPWDSSFGCWGKFVARVAPRR